MRLIRAFSIVGIIFLLPTSPVFSADTPTFQDGLLSIPTVNTPTQVGQYQAVTFEFTAQDGWQLLNFKEVGTQGLGLEAMVEAVELVKTDVIPVQVLLRVTGYFSGGCPSIGQINHRLEDNQFEVVIHSTRPTPVEEFACTAAIVPFRKTIPLPVYGLSAGTYAYRINGSNNGTFELVVDNELSGDCEGSCQDVELTF